MERAYRRLMLAIVVSALLHGVAVLAMATLLAPGLDVDTPPLERARYVADNAWCWRLGWLPWQLTALSNLLLGLALVAYCRRLSAAPRGWALAALAVTVASLVPDQWGEAVVVSSYVDEARAVVAGSGGVDAFVLREAWVLRMTGVYAGGGYIVMGCLWMVVGVQLAGGWQRQRAFVIAGTAVWLAFTVGLCLVWRSTAGALAGYPGFDAVYAANALAFPGLILWMFWLAYVVARGQHQRLPAADAALHRLQWPRRGALGRLLATLSSAEMRDVARPIVSLLPFPVMKSDIRDVVYLNWLVPCERVAAWLPAPLALHELDGHTFVSLLTYNHGDFGPRMLGPLRRLLPSPSQSNWRLYVLPERAGASRDAIYFFKTSLSGALHVIASRLLTDGLPAQLPALLRHERQGGERGDRWVTDLLPGAGSAPDLHAEVEALTAAEAAAEPALPAAMARHFADWGEAVAYLVHQNRGVGVLAAHGQLYSSAIDIPIDVDQVVPARAVAIRSGFLADVVAGCEPFVFVVPNVPFQALGEQTTALRP